jgi:hypothetical protein
MLMLLLCVDCPALRDGAVTLNGTETNRSGHPQNWAPSLICLVRTLDSCGSLCVGGVVAATHGSVRAFKVLVGMFAALVVNQRHTRQHGLIPLAQM